MSEWDKGKGRQGKYKAGLERDAANSFFENFFALIRYVKISSKKQDWKGAILLIPQCNVLAYQLIDFYVQMVMCKKESTDC